TSVHIIRLRARLEQRLGASVPQTALFEHPTADTLAAYLAASATGRPARGRSGATAPAEGAEPAGATEPAEPARDATDDRRVAIIGVSLRFPGADSTDQFWANLRDGADNVRRLTPEELTRAGLTAEQRDAPDLVPVGGTLDGVTEFDARFFGLSPHEAGLTDPAHRLFLECCHQALEEGGYEDAGAETRTGVFAGSGMNLYGHQRPSGATGQPISADAPAGADPALGLQTAIAREPDFLATRVAYRLGLTGPAIGVQTACSTSLVAVHLATRALLTGEVDMALAGAAAVHFPQETGYRSHPGSILSPTGVCRAFDAEADGTVGGNGVAVVLLKRLDRALADGDTVHAVILGSAVNNDGARKIGFTAPGVAGQADVIRQALRDADVPAGTISYVEAHGTGTPLGDPVELEALARVLGEGERTAGACAVGSVKPGIGHLDSCAGMAGLLKTVLMLRHRTLVPTLHLNRPNPELALSNSALTLVSRLGPWSVPDGTPRRAGVSAFGVGGTNAHVVLEEAPPAATAVDEDEDGNARLPVLVPVSARDDDTLAELTARLGERLLRRPELAPADVATTLALGRRRRPARTTVVGGTAEELAQALAASAGERTDPPRPLGPLAFAFPGQGTARPGMARGLYAGSAAARRTLERCAEVYTAEHGGDLLEALLEEPADGSAAGSPDGSASPGAVWPTATAQVALFAHQAALAAAWRAAGVEPSLVLGHSVGEYAALHTAGGLTLEDGVRLTAWRGRLMQSACPPGGMLAVRADAATAQRVADAAGAEHATANGPLSHVLAGSPEAVEEAARLCGAEGVRSRVLPVDRAFHSSLMEPALTEFRELAGSVSYRPLRVPVVTTADGLARAVGWTVDADHLCRQARDQVRFDLAMETATGQGYTEFVEIGAGNTLAGIGRHCAPASRWLSGQGEGDAPSQVRGFLTALGSLHERGAELDWTVLAGQGRRVPLPGHPLRRKPVGTPITPATPLAQAPAVPADAIPDAMPDAVPAAEPAVVVEAPAVAGTAATAADDELLRGVQEVTAAKLGMTPDEVEPDRSFFEMGADSLSLMGLNTELDHRYGVRVPVRDLFDSADTPRRLATQLS
ncbi:type I polyketide synthase, partial [Streptomyces sp. SM14]|uniref:type I polyketide synthase n=3 Tax=unclassified Streptomyces TaxID=2593676 RepID=UPI0011B0D1FC